MQRSLILLFAGLVALTPGCGSKDSGPKWPESKRAVSYTAPRRDGTTLMTVLANGTVEIGGREIEPGKLDLVDAHLTPIGTSTSARMPPKSTPTESRIADSALRIRIDSGAPLSVVTPLIERTLQTLCVSWPGAAQIYFEVASPSIKTPRIFPVLVRSIVGAPGKSPDRSYVALRVTTVAALPEGHDAARPWTLTSTPNAGGAPEVAAALTWDEVKQRVAATAVPSEIVLDVAALASTTWAEAQALLDQAAEVRLDEVSLRAGR